MREHTCNIYPKRIFIMFKSLLPAGIAATSLDRLHAAYLMTSDRSTCIIICTRSILVVLLQKIKRTGRELLLLQYLSTRFATLDNTNARCTTCRLIDDRSRGLGSRGRSRSSKFLLIGGCFCGGRLGFCFLLSRLLLSGLFSGLFLGSLSLSGLLLRFCLLDKK